MLYFGGGNLFSKLGLKVKYYCTNILVEAFINYHGFVDDVSLYVCIGKSMHKTK